MKINKQHTMGIAIVIVFVAAGSFFGGMKYQQTQRISGFPQGQMGQRPNGNGGLANNQRNGFLPVAGNIVSMDSKSITVKMQDGSSKIVLINDKTVINKTSEAVQSDLAVGDTVNVFGTNNTDGSVTAQNVQLNPQMPGASRGAAGAK